MVCRNSIPSLCYCYICVLAIEEDNSIYDYDAKFIEIRCYYNGGFECRLKYLILIGHC